MEEPVQVEGDREEGDACSPDVCEDGTEEKIAETGNPCILGTDGCDDPFTAPNFGLPVGNHRCVFDPTNATWSSGLYCCVQEEFSLRQWEHYQLCKEIWERADEKDRIQEEMDEQGEEPPPEDACGAGGDSIDVAGQEVEASMEKLTVSSEQQDQEEDDESETCEESSRVTVAAAAAHFRDAATSPIPSFLYDEANSDLSLSLEPISSSSFHSSSDGDGDST